MSAFRSLSQRSWNALSDSPARGVILSRWHSRPNRPLQVSGRPRKPPLCLMPATWNQCESQSTTMLCVRSPRPPSFVAFWSPPMNKLLPSASTVEVGSSRRFGLMPRANSPWMARTGTPRLLSTAVCHSSRVANCFRCVGALQWRVLWHLLRPAWQYGVRRASSRSKA